MKTNLLKNALIAFTFLFSLTATAQLEYTFDTDGDLEGFTIAGPGGGASGTVSGGILSASNTGANLQLRRNGTDIGDPTTLTTVILEVKNNSNADQVLIQVVSGGTTTVFTQAITPADATEKLYQIDISDAAWVGNFQLRLLFKIDAGSSLDGNAIEINRIQIVDPTSLSVKQNTLEGVSAYPNPVSETLSINSPVGSDIIFYNVLGATVKTVKKANALQDVSVSDLRSGLYFMKVVNEGKIFQTKIMKR